MIITSFHAKVIHFSERERTFTFALYALVRLSVVCL